MHRIIIISFFFALSLIHLQAQFLQEKDFILFGTQQGLSSKKVSAITQDIYGYLWIASSKGLNRFDGNSFEHFYADSNMNSLPEDEISRLKWIDKEQLAAITPLGLHIINTRSMKHRNLIVPPGELSYAFKVNFVSDISSDERGNVFILTRSGFYEFNNQDKLVFRYDAYTKQEAETETFVWGNSLAKAGDGMLLLSTNKGIYLFNSSAKTLCLASQSNNDFCRQVASEGHTRFFQADDTSFTLFTGITSEIIRYNTKLKKRFSIPLFFKGFDKFDWRSKFFKINDTLYAITNKERGFYLINYNPSTQLYKFNPHLYFENYYCSNLFTDHNNILWIGTNEGLFKQNSSPSLIEALTVPVSINLVNKNLKLTAVVVAGNKIFASTYADGVMVFDENTLAPLKLINLSAYWPSSNHINNLLVVNADTVYAGTEGPLIWINTKNYSTGKVFLAEWKDDNWISAQYKDSKNNIYVTKNDCTLFYFRKSGSGDFKPQKNIEKFSNLNFPSAITEDSAGNIWFAGHGLCRYNYKLGKFDMLLDSFPGIKTPRKEATGIYFDKKGTAYFGVLHNGLMIYNPVQKTYTQLTREDGLPDNTILGLFLHKNKLWIATESGLASYDINKKNISPFGIEDGMPADILTSNNFFYNETDNKLYSAFNKSIVRFDPGKLIKNTTPPLFLIENISVEEEQVFYHPETTITLGHLQNNFIVYLGAVNFTDAYLQRFAYRFVKTGNEPWHKTNSQRNIIFSNLAPGQYKLQVKAFSKNNSWQEQVKEITINITPPFWKSNWFILLTAIAAVSLVYLFYRRRIKQLEQKANIDRLLAQTEMKALHAQMNPHFIFNCLNSIREMILNNENSQASVYLSKFARLIRITLNHSSKSFITLQETIDYLERYIEMEQIRNSNFICNIKADEQLPADDILLPPMLIQPFIENAIWHGTIPGKQLHVTIHFRKDNDYLICVIDDDGIGINTSLQNKQTLSDNESFGILNTKQRIYLLNEKYRLHCSVTIEDKSVKSGQHETGTIITLYLPAKHYEL